MHNVDNGFRAWTHAKKTMQEIERWHICLLPTPSLPTSRKSIVHVHRTVILLSWNVVLCA